MVYHQVFSMKQEAPAFRQGWVTQADKWFASSKTCSICGYKNSSLSLSGRSWECPNCGQIHDRDTNAGKNLKQYGLQDLGLGQSDFKPAERKTTDGLPSSFLNETGSPCLKAGVGHRY